VTHEHVWSVMGRRNRLCLECGVFDPPPPDVEEPHLRKPWHPLDPNAPMMGGYVELPEDELRAYAKALANLPRQAP
jgi:hypothetical protein